MSTIRLHFSSFLGPSKELKKMLGFALVDFLDICLIVGTLASCRRWRAQRRSVTHHMSGNSWEREKDGRQSASYHPKHAALYVWNLGYSWFLVCTSFDCLTFASSCLAARKPLSTHPCWTCAVRKDHIKGGRGAFNFTEFSRFQCFDSCDDEVCGTTLSLLTYNLYRVMCWAVA